jgi:general secretion pathway protein J
MPSPTRRSGRPAAVKGPGERGMTLVELLVTLTLLGVLSLTLLGSVRFGARTWDVAHESGAARDEITLAQNFLRRRLAEVVAKDRGVAVGDKTGYELRGDGGSLAFVAPWLGAIAQGGLYSFEVAQTEGDLMLSWRPAEADEEELSGRAAALVGSRALLREVEEVSFQYFGIKSADQEPGWHEDWENVSNLPALVRLEVTFADGQRKSWPLFVVALAGG